MTGAIPSPWLEALEERHLADLRFAELTRALRALSGVYVQRRAAIRSGAALESHGKRAAFALFYGPLHFLVVQHAVRALAAHDRMPPSIVDLGCGTGAAGASWAIAAAGSPGVATIPRVLGIDRHPWAVREARWTYERLGLAGTVRRADLSHVRWPPGSAVLAAYVLNELPDTTRAALVDRLLDRSAQGPARVLIIEPISRAVAPWWEALRDRVAADGGRADDWEIRPDLSPILRKLDRAAGLDHSTIKARSIYLRRR